MWKNGLVEVRWHGRGGQGAVTAAEVLAHAAISQGKYAQAAPSFGAERRGAPVLAFNRIDDRMPIRLRCEVYEPDIVVVMDPTLLRTVKVTEGLKSSGLVIMNTKKGPGEARLNTDAKVVTIDARRIAMDTIGLPIVNTVMLGAFVKSTGLVDLERVMEAVKERFGGKVGTLNAEAVRRAYDETKADG